MAPVGVGIIGLDHWYAAVPLAEGIARNPDTTLVGIGDPDAARAGEVASRCGTDRVEEKWEALLEDPSVQLVLNYASVDQNPAICIAAAEAGKHMVSIKPLARTLPEADQVVAAVRRAGVHLIPSESRWRLAPRTAYAKAWYESGKPGRLLNATMTLWTGLPHRWPGDPEPGWFTDPTRTVGGAWIDHSIYQIDQLRWILGEEVVSVKGAAANFTHPELDLEDFGVGVLTFSGGLIATLEDTWTAPTGQFHMSTRFAGVNAALDLDGITDRQLDVGGGLPAPGWTQTQQPAPRNPAGDLDHLVAVVRGEAEPIATVEDGWRNLAACLAFYESVASAQTVTPAKGPR